MTLDDRRIFIVRRICARSIDGFTGWSVRFGDAEGIDVDLESAVHNALDVVRA